MQRAGDAEVARRADHLVAPDPLGQPHRRDIARPGEGLAQRDSPAIAPVAVRRLPAVDRQRRIVDLVVRGQPGAERGEVDEQLEGRAGLAQRLGRAVERAGGVIAAADHRDHPPVGPHRDQRDLRAAEPGAGDGALGGRLQPAVECRRDLLLGIEHAGPVARRGITQSAK